jgi:hypothetical protein
MKVGLSTGDSTGAVAEFWQINTIANMLDACIKTTGGVYTNTSTNCGMLFANVQAASGTNPVTNAAYAPPADTIQAAVYLALTPAVAASNIANLAPLAGKFGTFTPYVSSASAIIDYTVAIQFIPVIPTTTTTLLTQPTAVAIDSNGNAWVVNQAGSGTYVTTAIELSPTGVPMQAGTTAGTSPNNYLLSTYTMGGGTTTFGGQLIYNQTAEAWQSVGYLDAALDTTTTCGSTTAGSIMKLRSWAPVLTDRESPRTEATRGMRADMERSVSSCPPAAHPTSPRSTPRTISGSTSTGL